MERGKKARRVNEGKKSERTKKGREEEITDGRGKEGK